MGIELSFDERYMRVYKEEALKLQSKQIGDLIIYYDANKGQSQADSVWEKGILQPAEINNFNADAFAEFFKFERETGVPYIAVRMDSCYIVRPSYIPEWDKVLVLNPPKDIATEDMTLEMWNWYAEGSFANMKWG